MTQRFLVSAALVLLPLSAFAQQRPLVTEDPETIGAGRILAEAGFDYGSDVSYPASGLEGNLLRVPLLGASIGVSSIAEVQIDGGLYNRLSITERNVAPLSDMVTATGDTTSSVEDWSIGMKVRFLSEGARRTGVRVSLCHQASQRVERERPWPGYDRLLCLRAGGQDRAARSASSATSGWGSWATRRGATGRTTY